MSKFCMSSFAWGSFFPLFTLIWREKFDFKVKVILGILEGRSYLIFGTFNSI